MSALCHMTSSSAGVSPPKEPDSSGGALRSEIVESIFQLAVGRRGQCSATVEADDFTNCHTLFVILRSVSDEES